MLIDYENDVRMRTQCNIRQDQLTRLADHGENRGCSVCIQTYSHQLVSQIKLYSAREYDNQIIIQSVCEKSVTVLSNKY